MVAQDILSRRGGRANYTKREKSVVGNALKKLEKFRPTLTHAAHWTSVRIPSPGIRQSFAI
jgi:hypothetical protein